MQMARANVKGGGIGSRVVKEVGYRTGKPATRISPGGASQIGESVGNKATDSNRMLRKSADPVREGSFPAGSIGAVKLGNEVARNVCGGGPGKGRELLGKSGTNQVYGAPAQGNPPKGGELFPGFGKSGGK
jgi:hypothetical protein